MGPGTMHLSRADTLPVTWVTQACALSQVAPQRNAIQDLTANISSNA